MRRIVVVAVLALLPTLPLVAPAKKLPSAVIVGEVKQPGRYIVTEKMTVGELIAAAGGLADPAAAIVLIGDGGRRIEPADLVIAGQMVVASEP